MNMKRRQTNLAGQGGINCQNCLYCFFYKEGAPAALSCVSSIGLVRYQDYANRLHMISSRNLAHAKQSTLASSQCMICTENDLKSASTMTASLGFFLNLKLVMCTGSNHTPQTIVLSWHLLYLYGKRLILLYNTSQDSMHGCQKSSFWSVCLCYLPFTPYHSPPVSYTLAELQDLKGPAKNS